MRILVRAIIGAFALFGVLVLSLCLFVGIGIVNQDLFRFHADSVLSSMVLRVSFDNPLPEVAEAGFGLVSGNQMTTIEMVQILDYAATDPTVRGLIARIGDTGRSLAQAQELHAAILRFRESGKPTFAFTETIGEAPGSIADYVLASAFSEIWLQPSGTLGLSGFGTEVPFIRRALHKVGIDYELSQRWEYKSAFDSVVRDDMSAAHRESLSRLLRSWQDQAVAGITQGRSLETSVVRSSSRVLPFLAEEARDAGLVDHLGYLDDAVRALYAAAGTEEEALIEDYASFAGKQKGDHTTPVIALVHEAGPITAGKSEQSPPSGRIGSDTVIEAMRTALSDTNVKAILLRINTPGGDYVASDAIWNQLAKAREKGVPVVVSMADYAASGGYFVSMPAHKIVASPATLTGSIGVFSGKAVLSGLWEKLGVSWERVEAAPNTLTNSSTQSFTEEEKAWMEKRLDAIYADFTSKLAEARGLSPDQVDRVARGRIWSGQQAKERGLVDELGGFATAVRVAREAIGVEEGQSVRIVSFPPPKTGFEQFIALFETRLGMMDSLHVLSGFITRLQPVMVALLDVFPRSSAVTMQVPGTP